MNTQTAAKLFEALSSGIRLDIFRLLVKHAPQGLVAGEISNQLNLPATNLSFHLKAIAHTGLVNMAKEGRFSRYRANIPLMLEVIAYLTAECCAAHPEHCLDFRKGCAVPLGALPLLGEVKDK